MTKEKLTGQQLHKIWADACPWSSVGFERDWETMHPHRKEKWNELAKFLNGEIKVVGFEQHADK